jgi:hypothetical protein
MPPVATPIARYTAPAIPKPRAVSHLRVRRAGSRLTVRFGGARGAKTYRVKILLSDGRGLQRTLRASQHKVSVSGVGRRVHARVTVTPVAADARRGPVRRARV